MSHLQKLDLINIPHLLEELEKYLPDSIFVSVKAVFYGNSTFNYFVIEFLRFTTRLSTTSNGVKMMQTSTLLFYAQMEIGEEEP